MSFMEIGHPTWSRADADRIAWVLVDQASCTSVRLVPPHGPGDGWAVCAIYVDEASRDRPQEGGEAA